MGGAAAWMAILFLWGVAIGAFLERLVTAFCRLQGKHSPK